MNNNTSDFTLFFREYPSDSDFYFCSQWYVSDFEYRGKVFKSAEHWMMVQKAIMFNDIPMAEKILNCDTPKDAKDFGKEVRNFIDEIWLKNNKKIIYVGTKEKFLQDHEILKKLLHTNGSILVEASPYDKLYGIKLGLKDPKAHNPFLWQGENLLGEVITKFREDTLSGKIWKTVDLSKKIYADAKAIVDAYLAEHPYQKTVLQVRGDILKAFDNKEVDVILQSCHCFNNMGVGLSKKIRDRYPEAEAADNATIRGDVAKIGTYSVAELPDGRAIINAYAQYGYGKIGPRADEVLNNETDVKGRDPDRPHVSYDSLRTILKNVNEEFKGKRIALPTIGADLGRSDWNRIKGIIKETLTDVDVRIIYFHEVVMKKRFKNETGFGMG